MDGGDSVSDSGEKTEKATPHHLKKVREDGGLQKSQDLTGWISLAAGAALLPSLMDTAGHNGREQIAAVRELVNGVSMTEILGFLGQSLQGVLWTLLPFMLAIMLVAVLVNIIQGKGVFPSAKHLKPKLQNLNLVKGVKKIAGVQALWNGLKALLKTVAVGVVLYLIISGVMEIMGAAGHMSGRDLVNYGTDKMWLLIWASVIAGIVVSILDALFIFKKNQKQTKMSKQEVKEEYKQQEGDPQIKSQRRSRALQMSRNRMMNDAAEADVVVVNPTHYAVALKYEPGQGAPKVVAKGVDHLASRIREIALDNRVPMVEDVALARTLYSTAEIGVEIPEELYTAVAQVLAFCLLLKKRGARGGIHKMPQDLFAQMAPRDPEN
nr:EscU/YscU/HrcU family type III secretion system export apparatus switch protein [Mobiluncus mulieris]